MTTPAEHAENSRDEWSAQHCAICSNKRDDNESANAYADEQAGLHIGFEFLLLLDTKIPSSGLVGMRKARPRSRIHETPGLLTLPEG